MMRIKLYVLAATAAAAVCGTTLVCAAEPSLDNTRKIRAPQICPASDFNEFADAFANSIEIQASFTRFPLEKQSVDKAASPEPRPVVSLLSKRQVNFPVMPSSREQSKNNLKMTKEVRSSRRAVILIVKDDTDYQMRYFFEKSQCWQLIRIEDDSL